MLKDEPDNAGFCTIMLETCSKTRIDAHVMDDRAAVISGTALQVGFEESPNRFDTISRARKTQSSL
jgi:hypothetical protein